MSAFEDWHTQEIETRLFYKEPEDIADEAFNAGRAHQREVDAKIVEADNPLLNYAICQNIVKILAKAIREQKIDG